MDYVHNGNLMLQILITAYISYVFIVDILIKHFHSTWTNFTSCCHLSEFGRHSCSVLLYSDIIARCTSTRVTLNFQWKVFNEFHSTHASIKVLLIHHNISILCKISHDWLLLEFPFQQYFLIHMMDESWRRDRLCLRKQEREKTASPLVYMLSSRKVDSTHSPLQPI